MNLPSAEMLTASGYWMLVPLAFAFMVGWWFKFGVLADIGVYVVVVVLLGFGLIGSYTYGRARH
ncbi:MAG: hypothetical protein QF766_04000 [Candidatus Poseidoniia archaeon]|nr:hypothetical protein [Candidatus Poseidoniia archaeon]MDP7535920.1 hypothetical protein [Candidatus Poseidoniia archaeon]MDP7607865.1 hypothetical protein [Candidatus Poseidoniia archaeon]HJP43991.1 hypothetical protein [Candidatus Poseidoniia archaeon]|tara:strand:- start:1013 stop:1204 length:192 start_codon:yes stop_codon:yes gene_type:complete